MHADKDYYLKSTDGKTPFLTVSTQPAALEKEDGRHQQLSHMQTPFLCQTRLCRKQTFILCWVWIEQYGFIRKTFSQTGEEKKRKKKEKFVDFRTCQSTTGCRSSFGTNVIYCDFKHKNACRPDVLLQRKDLCLIMGSSVLLFHN